MSNESEYQLCIVNRTKDYICSLPNGSNLTLAEAIKSACPGELENLDLLDFTLLSAVVDEVNSTDTVIDLSDHEDMYEGLPFNLDFYVWKKRIQKVQIKSDLQGHGSAPGLNKPAEQKLTISSNGGIWLYEYMIGNAGSEKRAIGRRIQFPIGRNRTARILSFVADYFESNPKDAVNTDAASWKMVAFTTDGSKRVQCGPMGEKVMSGNVDLDKLIHENVPIEELKVFC